ncbi:MAG: hypothetical protein ACK4LB_00385 [Spirosomataceae bacterium]
MMKKSIMMLATVIGVSLATQTFANDMRIVALARPASDLQLVAVEGMKFKLTADKLQNRSYVAIKSQDGEVLFSEFVVTREGRYAKVFDLSKLTDGTYLFVIENGSEKLEKPFVIATEVKRTVVPAGK